MGLASLFNRRDWRSRYALLRLSLGVLSKESASIACSVIDFASQCCRIASLVFHCVGSAITNNVSVLRTQQKQREITFKYTWSHLSSVFWLFEQHLVCYCSRSPRDSGGMGDCCYDAQSVKELWVFSYLCLHDTHNEHNIPATSPAHNSTSSQYPS